MYQLTSKANTVAVVTDGSAVLGLGNIGASAAIPVMEGKCVLFKKFGKKKNSLEDEDYNLESIFTNLTLPKRVQGN